MSSETSIGEDAVLRATGRGWREWFGVLNAAGMNRRSQQEIAAFLRERHGLPAWWQQCVTREFEKSIGRFEETAEGCEITVQQTIHRPAAAIYAAWVEEPLRNRWLRRSDFVPTSFDAPRSVQGRWKPDGSHLEVDVEDAGEGACRLTIRQRGLSSPARAEEMKAFWKSALERILKKVPHEVAR